MKTVILSNGNLNVGLNEYGLVSDFYFPDNGYNNHTLAEEMFHRIGVRVDGQFSWLNSGEWQFNFDYFSDGLISKISAFHQSLQLELEFNDFCASDFDGFLRSVKVANLSSFEREIQLFFHQNFAINSSFHRADTVQFLPQKQAILHYRGARAFLVGAERKQILPSGELEFSGFNQQTVGLFGIENKLGSWLDAEDGRLADCRVEHGQTDSVFGFDFKLAAGEASDFQYYLLCADSHDTVFELQEKVKAEGFAKVFAANHKYWQKWLTPTLKNAQKLPLKYRKKFVQSVMLVKSHIARTGAVIASNDSEMLRHARDDYSYCWPRDALYALWPLIRLGYRQEPLRFFEFCQKVMNPDGYLAHKYLPSGEPGPSWHPYSHQNQVILPIQIDETAGAVFLFGQYFEKFHDDVALDRFFGQLIKPMADFLADFVDENGLAKPSYELWEMDFLSTAYSTSLVMAALEAASELARIAKSPRSASRWQQKAALIRQNFATNFWNREKQFINRGIWPGGEISQIIDASSFFGAFMFSALDQKSLNQAFDSLSKRFSADKNAIPRFENDIYYRFSDDYEANFWIISSLWRAEFLLAEGRVAESEEILDWVADRASSAGILPEQTDPRDNSWLSVAPLTWSQAELVSALLDYINATQLILILSTKQKQPPFDGCFLQKN